MTMLIVTRGLPGSGKSTRAKKWVDVDVRTRFRVNRDDLRDMGHGRRTGVGEAEDAVTVAQLAAVTALLTAGVAVVVDDTNLNPDHYRRLCALAEPLGLPHFTWDLTDVPLETCIERDRERAARGEPAVGEDVIRGMHTRWLVPFTEGSDST